MLTLRTPLQDRLVNKHADTPLRAGVRRLWRLPAVLLWIGCGLVLSLGMAIWQRLSAQPLNARRQQLASWWMRGLIGILPLRVCGHGQLQTGTRLLVSNHVSWLDIIVIGAHAPVHFLSKAEVRDWPLIGWLASAAGTLFIQRGQASGSALQQQLTGALQQGRSLVIFAEGTTTAGDQVRTFHGRLLSCAIESATLVQPIALGYYRNGERDKTAPFINDDEFSAHLFRLLGSPRIDVQLHFLDDLQPGTGNRNQLARSAQLAVSQALGLADATLKADVEVQAKSAA